MSRLNQPCILSIYPCPSYITIGN
ncbi:hypothetical protein KSS87_014068 [Heliosperma pusillum]|nr:hypothetical protein KSS87_014068 [Heliosperma pusillum]